MTGVDTGNSDGAQLVPNGTHDSNLKKFSCHQCRQKTIELVAACTSMIGERQCVLKYCHRCLWNRYKVNAANVVVLKEWSCPKCRGLCNCSACRRRRGEEPIGMLSRKAKEAGFSSIQEMLNAGSPQGSLTGSVTPTKDSVTVSLKSPGKENSPDGHCGLYLNVHNVIAEKDENNSKRRKEFDVGIRLPQGNSSVTLAGIELPPESVGDAIQFLEFCASFGEVFGIKKEQAEGIIRELIVPSSNQGQQHPLIVAMHYQLLSLIDKDHRERSLSLSPSAEEESWLEALGKCLSNSKYPVKNLPSDCFDKDGDGYEKLEGSQKLKLLIFLCDEALCTTALRNYIDNKNSEFALNKKSVKATILAAKEKEKQLKRKLKDEVAKANIATNGALSSHPEYEATILRIQSEADQAHAEMLEAIKTVPKRKRSAVLRTESVVGGANGQIFWRMNCFDGKPNILLQDVGTSNGTQEKWFSYEAEQEQELEKYFSALRRKKRETHKNSDTPSNASMETDS